MNNKFAEATKIEKRKIKKEFKCPHFELLANKIKCELCEDEIKSKMKMESHMKTHSYKVVNYKFKECVCFCETE